MRTFIIFTALIMFSTFSATSAVLAENQDMAEPSPPPTIHDLETIPKLNKIVDAETGLPFDIRKEAVREAALSYGARGGLSWRTYQIRRELEKNASYLDKVFDFRQLLIAAPSGLIIEPPIISEAENAMIIDGGGMNASVADRYYHINDNARIVSTARNWRTYLQRNWGEVTPPPDILRPNDKREREIWVELVREGWEQGVQQADEVFQDDLNRLRADFVGMVRYRMLLAQNMVSPPYALQVDRGVTGGGNEMRVGDRGVKITGIPVLKPGYDEWKPVSR
jgi:defect-in-organelle-trafficking protein DotC